MTKRPSPFDSKSTEELEARLAELRARIDDKRRSTGGFIALDDLDEAADLIEELDRRFAAEEAEIGQVIHRLGTTSARLDGLKAKLKAP